MKLVIATPLYPPDIAEPAPYVKELAARLAKEHEVVVVAYGRLPEPVPGARIVAVRKDRPLLLRLLAFTRALADEAVSADAVIAENGASVELPAAFVSLFSHTPFFFHVGDQAAHENAQKNLPRHVIERIMRAHARAIIEDRPLPHPEVIPLQPEPVREEEEAEASWQRHVELLTETLAHA
jgi:hypothetical protein